MNPKDKGRVGRTSERSGEAQFCKVLDAMGIYNEHMENNSVSGFPDRYLCQGRWIEFKAIVYTYAPKGAGRPKRVATLLRRSQKRQIPKLLAGGDQVWLVVFLYGDTTAQNRFVMGPYHDIMNMTEKRMDDEAVRFGQALPETLEKIRNTLNV